MRFCFNFFFLITFDEISTKQIPATPLPREIHFKSDKEEIEAFVSRDALDEDLKTTSLSETSEDLKQITNSNGVFDNCLGESTSSSTYNSTSLIQQSSNHTELNPDSNTSSKTNSKTPLDLSPENFFMTSNEMNGQCHNISYFFFPLCSLAFVSLGSFILTFT